MMEMARSHRAELPRVVLDFICECCGALLVPSLSADVRVQPQTHKSSANRKLTRQRRKLQAQFGTPIVPQILLNVLVRMRLVMRSYLHELMRLTP